MPPNSSHIPAMPRPIAASLRLLALLLVVAHLLAVPARATILWQDQGARVVHNTGEGVDILGGKVKRDNKASDELYFRFHVDPISDVDSEPYLADMVAVTAAAVHGVLGIQPTWEKLVVTPCLPADWPRAEADVLYKGRRHHVTVEGGTAQIGRASCRERVCHNV